MSSDGHWVLGSGEGARVWDVASGILLAALDPRSWTTGGSRLGGGFLPMSDGVLLGEVNRLEGDDARSWIWRFARDERKVTELLDLASLLAGYRVVSESSAPVPLTAAELQQAWERQRQRHPDAALVPAEKVAAWHRRRGEELAGEGRHAEALRHFDAVVEAGPPRATVFERRGHTRAELGHLEEAEADFRRAAELRAGFPDLWSHAALLRLARGNLAGQRRICSDLLRESGTTQNPDRAYWIARTCALVADGATIYGEVDRDLAVRLAELALPLSAGLEAEVLDLRGAALYRAGRHEEARDRLLAAAEARGGATAWGAAFLALAHHRLGEGREARRWLGRAEEPPDDAENAGSDEAPPWKERLEAEALLAEARATLGVNERNGAALSNGAVIPKAAVIPIP